MKLRAAKSNRATFKTESSILPLCRAHQSFERSTNGAAAELDAHHKPSPMSDWCKLYDNDLTDIRMQWAMNSNPHVAIAYVYLLTLCCTHKSGTIPWDPDVDFLALGSAMRISGPLANDAIRMLEHIEKIHVENKRLTVVGWTERQSDYLNRKPYFQKRYQESKGVHSEKSENCEIHTEEKRVDKKRNKKGDPKPEALNIKKEVHITGKGKLAGEALFEKTGDMPHEFLEPSEEDPFPP